MRKIKAPGEKRDMTTDDLKAFLKTLIDRNGFACLSTDAFEIYSLLPKRRPRNRRMAGALLLTLLNEIPERVREAGWHHRDLCELIHEECLLAEETASELAEIYLEVFSEANYRAWEAQKEQGFAEFCEQDWLISWEDASIWYVQNVHVDCEAQADIVIQVQDMDRIRAALASELQRNPFITAGDILAWFAEKLRNQLSRDFSAYVQAEEYYPPVAEDYEACETAKSFCLEYGFRLISCERQ